MKPVIALTPWLRDERIGASRDYMDMLSAAGALGFLLPIALDDSDVAQVLSHFDGILFTGGEDVDPALYGESLGEAWRDTVKVCAERDATEVKLAHAAWDAHVPMLGICRGVQLINVALGGKLWQDIPSQCPGEAGTNHFQQPPYERPQHRVRVLPGTPLADIAGDEYIMVNSTHHQAVKEIAPCLREMAETDAGLIEAVYSPERSFVMGLQWHPERLWHNMPCHFNAARMFVDACAAKREGNNR